MKKQQSYLHKDITNEVITACAVFGLVVSSLVATLGVAALGVQAQVASAQYESAAYQTAAVAMGDNRAVGDMRPPMPAVSPQDIASSTMPMYCPQISRVIARGANDATTTGDIGELQRFIVNRYHLEASSTITGYFGSTTQGYLERFQQEQGISPSPTVGPLTRAAIAKLCGGSFGNGHMGSTTPMRGDVRPEVRPMMGSTTRPALPGGEYRDNRIPPPPPLPPLPTKTTSSSNGAAAIEGMQEIGDGVSKIVTAYFSLFGV